MNFSISPYYAASLRPTVRRQCADNTHSWTVNKEFFATSTEMSEIDWAQTLNETAFWWRHKGPVTSQFTDLIRWPIYILIAFLFLAFNLYSWAHMWQIIHHTKMSPIDTCTIVFDIVLCWWDCSLGGWHTLFCTINNRSLCCNKGTCKFAPLPYMDGDGETNDGTLLSRGLKYPFCQWTRQWIHNTSIVVARYLQLMAVETIPDAWEPRQ